MNVFFLHIGIFSLPAAGRFSRVVSRALSASGHAGNPPEHHGESVALAKVRSTCSGGSKSQITTGRHSEHVEPSRPMKTHVQIIKKCPTAHVISRGS